MAMDGDGGTLKWKSFLEIILGRRFHVFTAWQGGGNESLVLVFYECGVDRSSRCSLCGSDKVMKTRLLKRPVRFYCHIEEYIMSLNKDLLSDEFFMAIDAMKNYKSGFSMYNFSIESLGVKSIKKGSCHTKVNVIKIKCFSAGVPIDFVQLQIPLNENWWNDWQYQESFKSNISIDGELFPKNVIGIQFEKRWLNILPNYIDRISVFSYIESCLNAFEIWNDNK